MKSSGLTCAGCKSGIPRGRITCPVCRKVAFGAPRSADGRVKDGIWRLSEVTTTVIERVALGFADLNWGPPDQPGLPVTGVSLLAGAPGAGKSTLCAQVLSRFAKNTGKPALYVGAEESGEQVKDRALRLGLDNLADMLILPLEEQSAGHRLTPDVFDRWKPGACVIDSAQKFTQSPTEAVELCESVKDTAIRCRCPFLVISQVNKEEEFAGLNAFQHAADTLLKFTLADQLVTPQGRAILPPIDPGNPGSLEPFRVLKTTKNRFGPAGVETYFTMRADGLHVFELPAGMLVRAVERPIGGEDADSEDEEEGPESGEGIAFDEDGPIDPEEDEDEEETESPRAGRASPAGRLIER